MMNHLKDHLKDKENVKYLMTYADNHAMGFFKKNVSSYFFFISSTTIDQSLLLFQGFTTDITLERRLWVGFIKDYDEATIMQVVFDLLLFFFTILLLTYSASALFI